MKIKDFLKKKDKKTFDMEIYKEKAAPQTDSESDSVRDEIFGLESPSPTEADFGHRGNDKEKDQNRNLTGKFFGRQISKRTKSGTEKHKKPTPSSIVIEAGSSVRPNKYYENKSNVFGHAKFIVTLSLIAIVLLAFTIFSDVFTGENFKYLVKHISINVSGKGDYFRPVVFAGEDKMSFGGFGGDFVICAPEKLKLYDYNGAVSLNSTPSTQNPKMCLSEKYILLYDEGDRDFYIYNNFSLLFSKELQGKIICADMSHRGVFAVVTESIEYAGHIYLYNENFELLMEIKKVNPITGVSVSPEGEYLTIMTAALEGAEYSSAVTVYDIKEKAVILEDTINSEIALRAKYGDIYGKYDDADENDLDTEALDGEIGKGGKNAKDGKNKNSAVEDENFLCIITDKGIHSYSMDKKRGVFEFLHEDVLLFDASEEVVVYNARKSPIDHTSVLYVVDNNTMEKIYSMDFKEKIIDIKINGENIYILTRSELTIIDKDMNVKNIKAEKPINGMVIFSGGEVFFRYSDFAELVN